MPLKLLLPVAVFVALTATAAGAETYYVIQDTKTMKCTVVTEEPKADTLLGINILGLEFGTKLEADEAVKTTKVCVQH